MEFPPEDQEGTTATLALWSMLTYVYSAWPATPYLYVGGPLGSGKSRVFDILARIVCRPMASSNMTAPALFRTLHDRGGVVLLDEAERLKSNTPDQADLLSMFLAGYRRGGQAIRLEPVGDAFRSVSFDVYGPKALACIAGLPPALASRCINISMFRAGPDSEKPALRIDEEPEKWQHLRDDLHGLALEHGRVWPDLATRAHVCPVGIHGRSAELWQPLLALADWLEEQGGIGLLDVVQKHALRSIEANAIEQVPEADEVILELLADAVRRGETPTPGELLVAAREGDPDTFLRWNGRTVANRLKSYGLVTAKKSHGDRRYRDVTMAMLARIETHYAIDLGIGASTATSETATTF